MGRKNPVVAKIETRILEIDAEQASLKAMDQGLEREKIEMQRLLEVSPASPAAKPVRARKAAAQTEGTNANP